MLFDKITLSYQIIQLNTNLINLFTGDNLNFSGKKNIFENEDSITIIPRDFKGAFIPKEILLEKNLSYEAIGIYAFLESLPLDANLAPLFHLNGFKELVKADVINFKRD